MPTADQNRALLSPALVADQERWEWTRLKLRMLSGLWDEDVVDRMKEYLSALRTEDIGEPAQALNLFDTVNQQLSVIYDTTPTVANKALTPEQEADFAVVLELAHWGGLAQRNNLYVNGLRESFIRVLWTDKGTRLGLVTPDQIVLETVDGSPEDILTLRLAASYDDKPAWEVWNISEEEPTYYLETPTGEVIEGTTQAGDEYQWQDDDGPWVPFIKYRAQYTDRPFDARAQAQLVYGTLDVAVLWSDFFYVAMKAAWAQRYGIDVEPPSGLVKRTDAGKSNTVETSPTSILLMRSVEGKDGGTMSQFSASASPKDMADAVLRYQSTVLTNLGISPADLEMSLAAQSGIAIQLKRSAQRREATKALPNYELADQELMSMIARTENALNDDLGAPFPVADWRLQYHLPELSSDERKALLEQEKELLALGLASPVDLLMAVRPHLKTREAAMEALLEIRAEVAALNAPLETEPPEEEAPEPLPEDEPEEIEPKEA